MFIELEGVRQNNLKNIHAKIPINSFTVVCGPSGSGKTSLAFETLFAEGQRRYIESLSNYARQFLNQAPKPLLDKIQNIPPAIALEQKNTIKNSRSTVGTTSEVIEYLRLFYSKLATAHCPGGHGPIRSDSPTSTADCLIKEWNKKRIYLCVSLKQNKKRFKGSTLIQSLLSDGFNRLLFNQSRLKQKPDLKILEVNPKLKVKDLPKKDFYLVVDRLSLDKKDRGRLVDSINQAYEMAIKYNEKSKGQVTVISTENETRHFSEEFSCSKCDEILPPLSPQLFSFNSPVGACDFCNGFGNRLDIDEAKVVPNPNLSLKQGAILPFSMPSAARVRQKLWSYCKTKKIDRDKPWNQLTSKQRYLLWNGDRGFHGVRGYFKRLETKNTKCMFGFF